MAPAKDSPANSLVLPMLAGLQAGMLGVFWMLAWLGISAKWQLRSFWTAENLMASVFYGERSIRSGFAWQTVAGLSLYLLIYSLLGAIFAVVIAVAVSGLPARIRLVLLGILFAYGWYYLSFRIFGRSMMPLVALLHSTQPTALGHVLYGSLLGRYPTYLPHAEPSPEVVGAAAEAPQAESASD